MSLEEIKERCIKLKKRLFVDEKDVDRIEKETCVGIMKKTMGELTSLTLSNKPSCKSLNMDLVCLQVIYPLLISSLLLHFVLNTERKNETVQICSLQICRKFVKTEE